MAKIYQKKLWGKNYEDNRNRKEYNEHLVKSGEMYLTLDFVENWNNNLEETNKNKKSRPYEFPEQFTKFMAFVYIIFGIPYRQIECLARKLSELIPPFKDTNYTTLQKRIVKMKLGLDDTISDKIDDIITASDYSGVNVANRGKWMREK